MRQTRPVGSCDSYVSLGWKDHFFFINLMPTMMVFAIKAHTTCTVLLCTHPVPNNDNPPKLSNIYFVHSFVSRISRRSKQACFQFAERSSRSASWWSRQACRRTPKLLWLLPAAIHWQRSSIWMHPRQLLPCTNESGISTKDRGRGDSRRMPRFGMAESRRCVDVGYWQWLLVYYMLPLPSKGLSADNCAWRRTDARSEWLSDGASVFSDKASLFETTSATQF